MLANLFLHPLGIDLFCLGKKYLVFNLVSRNLKLKYRRSIFGIFWTLLNPIAVAAVYYFVFKVVLSVQMPHYLPFILSGVLPWTFFSQTLSEGMESIAGNWSLISKVPVPVQVFPCICSLTNFFTFLISLPVLFMAGWLSDAPFRLPLISLPFFVIALLSMTYSFALILAIIFVYLKDLRHLLNIILQLWFYGTPILYNENMIPAKYQFILALNPVAGIFTSLHQILIRGEWPATWHWIHVTLWTGSILVISAFFHKFYSRDIVENI